MVSAPFDDFEQDSLVHLQSRDEYHGMQATDVEDKLCQEE